MKSGSSRGAAALLLWLVTLAVFADGVGAADKKKGEEAFSVVAGAVFREPGFALPGAEVSLWPYSGEATPKKIKKMTFTANTRGEFAFRLPPTKAKYTVAVTAKGYAAQEKTVEVGAGERTDVTFTLVRESN